MHKLKAALERMAQERGLEKGTPQYKRYVDGGVRAAMRDRRTVETKEVESAS